MLKFIHGRLLSHAHLKLDRQRADVGHHKQVPFRLLKPIDKLSIGDDYLGIELKVDLLYTSCNPHSYANLSHHLFVTLRILGVSQYVEQRKKECL